ncbi:NADP-binding Rossmann-like domain containing protein [Nitzschia inconspicua]|uniref:NADP-binding Rossmann-like domain containing protein n=1 Tax=Nitzschia inconspicua TaxID=303405 RepID=A0A9K3PFB3_9STRA|nr:NADP-binding Rossmann-like domain containing protein [Nitzschia inconspicua]
MPPLHQLNIHQVDDDDNDEEEFVFLPLDERRWSDSSDVSAYCIHPDDEALRRHDYRPLQVKKVAVIGSHSSGTVCASTLRQDGHQVTLLSPSSLLDEVKEQWCHPDFPMPKNQSNSTQNLNYFHACAAHFGVTVKQNVQVTEMTEKFGGWVLTYGTLSPENDKLRHNESNEYFDFVVIADDVSTPIYSPPTTRFREQYLIPFLLGIVWILEHFIPLWTSIFLPKIPVQLGKEVEIPSYLPTKYREALCSKPKLLRRILSPEIPRVAFLREHSGCASSYLASVWLSTLLYGEMNVQRDPVADDSKQYRSILRYNDLLLQDLGLHHLRKDSSWDELFTTYSPNDYRGLLDQVQERRRISQREGWAVPLVAMAGVDA